MPQLPYSANDESSSVESQRQRLRGPGTFHCLEQQCLGNHPITKKNKKRHQHQDNFVECTGIACTYCPNWQGKYFTSISRLLYFSSLLIHLTFFYVSSPCSIFLIWLYFPHLALFSSPCSMSLTLLYVPHLALFSSPCSIFLTLPSFPHLALSSSPSPNLSLFSF